MKFFAVLLSTLAFAILAACSGDGSSSANENSSSVTQEDSSTVFVYSYDKFIGKSDVRILDDDTSKIAIDIDLAQRIHAVVFDSSKAVSDSMPKKGNVIVVWDAPKNAPYYLRVESATHDDDSLTLEVIHAESAEALPAGDYEFSSDLYYDNSIMDENGDGDSVPSLDGFYDRENNTFHPFMISVDGVDDENSDAVKYKTLTKGVLDDELEEKGYVDIREILATNKDFRMDISLINADWEFYPGTMFIPTSVDDYLFGNGEWSDFFDGEAAMEKAFKDNAGKDAMEELGENWSTKAYIRLDTLSYKSSARFRAHLKTDWMRPSKFEAIMSEQSELKISNIGVGIGGITALDKQLTKFPPYHGYFHVFGIPIRIDFYFQLYLKVSTEAFALFNYNLNFERTVSDTLGIAWDKKSGLTYIKNQHYSKTYNKPKSFSDFMSQSHLIFDGTINVGIYGRFSALFAGLGGPTIGVGARLDLNGDMEVKNLVDSEGNWQLADLDASASIDLAIPLEIGGEVRILGKRVFSRNYDVLDLKTFNLFSVDSRE